MEATTKAWEVEPEQEAAEEQLQWEAEASTAQRLGPPLRPRLEGSMAEAFAKEASVLGREPVAKLALASEAFPFEWAELPLGWGSNRLEPQRVLEQLHRY